MTTAIEQNSGWLRRAWRALCSWEHAMDYSPHDYAFDRISKLEREILALKAETRRLPSDGA